MIRSYVCRQCRIRLTRSVASPRSPRWQPTATFLSLRDVRSPTVSPTQDQSDRNHTEAAAAKDEGQSAPPVNIRRVSKYARFLPASETVQDPQKAADTYTRPVQRHSYAQEILKQKGLNNAWDYFLRTYPSRDCPALADQIPGDSAAFLRFSTTLVAQFANGLEVPATPSDVLLKYEQLGIARQQVWDATLGFLTDRILGSISNPSLAKRDTQSLLSELLTLWRLYTQCKGQQGDPPEFINSGWQSVPDTQSMPSLHHDTRFGTRLQQYYPEGAASPPLQFSAIVIFNIFSLPKRDTWEVPEPLLVETTPFIRFLAHLLAGSNVSAAFRHTEASSSFRALPDDIRMNVNEEIKLAPRRAMKMIGSQYGDEGQSESGLPSDRNLTKSEQASNLTKFFLKRIARAVRSQALVGVLEKLWVEANGSFASSDNKPAIPPPVYNAFLSGFMKLYRPDLTTTIWNHMIAHGVKPELSTWCSMLDGCIEARDINALRSLWTKMLGSGIEPDNYAWTTRISGLLALHQPDEAFAALDEMGRRWLAAQNVVQGSQNKRKDRGNSTANLKAAMNITKPSIEVINAAISGLVKSQSRFFDRKKKDVERVLTWGAHFGVKPDTRTYNAIVKMYLDAGDSPMALRLLAQMERQGIEGDVATHGMLIRAAFENKKFDGLSHTEQATRIIDMFSEIEASGVKLNTVVYSSAIERLVRLHGNFEAVRAVISHMMARNLTPASHIYTTLITHYFQQDPPDIPAVDGLVAQVFGPPRAPSDNIFFDRVIEGYAANGEVVKMMDVLNRMSLDGKLPSWQTLTAVVRALAKGDDWERTRLLVRDVQMREGIAKNGVVGGIKAQGEFFNLVKSLDRGLTDTLAGDYLRDTAQADSEREPSQSVEQLDMGPREGREALDANDSAVLGEELATAQAEQYPDEFVNAQHSSYLSWEPEPNEQQAKQGR